MKTRQSTSTSATPKKRKRRVTVTMKSRTSKRTSRVIKTETSPRPLSSAPKKPIVSRKSVAASSDNQVQLALDRLHTSSVPDWLPCRDKEYSAIANFVESTLRSGSSGFQFKNFSGFFFEYKFRNFIAACMSAVSLELARLHAVFKRCVRCKRKRSYRLLNISKLTE